MSRIEIATTGKASTTSIKLDGHDISAGLRGYEIIHEDPRLPVVVHLHPAVYEHVEVMVETDRVYVSPAASDLLCRLGWTPPAGAS